MGTTCETHNMCQKEVDRLKDDVSQLYDLDREQQKYMSEMRADITQIKTDNSYTKNSIAKLQTDMQNVKTDVANVKTDMSDVKVNVSSIEKEIKTLNKKLENNEKTVWKPKEIAVVIVAALSLIGTLATAILSFIK